MNSDPGNLFNLLSSLRYDLFSLLASILFIIAYHFFLRRKVRKNPTYTVQAINKIARTAWVETIMHDDHKGVLAVQTLRNSTMAASFMASTAILLIIGVLTLSAQGDKLSGTWHSLNFLGHASAEMWLFKLLMMLFDLLLVFFAFSMSVRLFHHIGYSINVPLERELERIQRRAVRVSRVRGSGNGCGGVHGLFLHARLHLVSHQSLTLL